MRCQIKWQSCLSLKSVHNYDNQLKKHLRKAGFTVRLQMSPYTEEMLKAAMGENVGLIKSIGVQYLGKVEQAVWASVKRWILI